jgi:hypothetical protein
MEGSERSEDRDPREAQREVDERIDELTREGEEMEERLEQAGSDAEDVDVPEADEAAGGGMSVGELAGGTDESESEDDPDEE